jgi:CHAT domain-containing protein
MILAGDRVLTIDAVLEAGLPVRLVVASNCESAFVHPSVPDEVVSLSAGLLYAGADAVLASGFAVDDVTAFLLTARFYDQWRPGTTGPQALQGAARFIRDTTNIEKLAWVENLSVKGWPDAVTGALGHLLGLTPPAELTFASPADWAAFTWWGCHVRA